MHKAAVYFGVLCVCAGVVLFGVLGGGSATSPEGPREPRESVVRPVVDADSSVTLTAVSTKGPSDSQDSDSDESYEEDESSESEEETRLITVYGTVTDAVTGKPIPNALVHNYSYLEMGAFLDDEEYDRRQSRNDNNSLSREELRALFRDCKPFPAGSHPYRDLANVVTDESGAYSIELNPIDSKYVSCRTQTHAIAVKAIKSQTPNRFRVDFQLQSAAIVAGKVTDAVTGEAVPNVRVVASTSGVDPFGTDLAFERSTLTNSNGSYEIVGLPEGRQRVRVEDRGLQWLFDREHAVNVMVREGETANDVNLVTTKGLRLEGDIRDEQGRPIQGAEITATVEDNYRYYRTGFSESDGSFVVHGLRPGKFRLHAEHERYAEDMIDFAIDSGKETDRVTLTLRAGSSVSGVLKYVPGPASFLRDSVFLVRGLNVSNELTGEPVRVLQANTDEKSGEFTFEHVLAGEYILTDMSPYEHSHSSRLVEIPTERKIAVSVDGSRPVSGLELRIEIEPEIEEPEKEVKPIRGIVLDKYGKPAADVGIWETSKEYEDAVEGRLSDPGTTTNKKGKFILEDLEDSVFTIYAECDTGEARQSNVKPGDKITLTLGPVTAVHGQVVNAAGNPVKGCRVELLPRRDGEAETVSRLMSRYMEDDSFDEAIVTDDFGNFTFRHMESGTYFVRARAMDQGFGESEAFSVQRGTEKLGVQIALDSGVAFKGIVTDKSGSPLVGATVGLSIAYAMPLDKFIVEKEVGYVPEAKNQSTSGGDGTFLFEGLKPGRYVVTAKHPDFAEFTSEEVDITATQSAPYAVVMSNGGTLRGRYAVNGNAKKGFYVDMLGAQEHYTGRTDANGHFEVNKISTGVYAVRLLDNQTPVKSFEDNSIPAVNAGSVEITDGEVVELNIGDGLGICGAVPAELRGATTFVYLVRKGAPELVLTLGGYDPMSWVAPNSESASQLVAAADVSDGANFDFADVEPGEYELRVYTSEVKTWEIVPLNSDKVPVHEVEQRIEEYRPKEVLRHAVTIDDQSLTVTIPSATGE